MIDRVIVIIKKEWDEKAGLVSVFNSAWCIDEATIWTHGAWTQPCARRTNWRRPHRAGGFSPGIFFRLRLEEPLVPVGSFDWD